jgi:Bacterial extracellular solute-binding protein, family 7
MRMSTRHAVTAILVLGLAVAGSAGPGQPQAQTAPRKLDLAHISASPESGAIGFKYGFRHFWNNRKPINSPADLKGLKMRVQQGRVFADTVNGLGASAVPMPWGEVVPAAQQGVIDGADLPIYNINALKVTRPPSTSR